MDILILMFFDFIITIFVYLTFPIFYLKVYKKTTKKNAKKIAFINSLVCSCFFYVVFFWIINRGYEISLKASGLGAALSSGTALFYYYIVKFILTDKQKKDKEWISCPNCGYVLYDDEEYCLNCGKKNPIYCEAVTEKKNIEKKYKNYNIKIKGNLKNTKYYLKKSKNKK